MPDKVYVMNVVVKERRKGRNAEGEFEYDEKVYENDFYFRSVGMRKVCADRIRHIEGVVVTFRHYVECAPMVVKRMVTKRQYKPYGE